MIIKNLRIPNDRKEELHALFKEYEDIFCNPGDPHSGTEMGDHIVFGMQEYDVTDNDGNKISTTKAVTITWNIEELDMRMPVTFRNRDEMVGYVRGFIACYKNVRK